MKRSKKQITYHGRTGYPMIHISKTGKKYIMVRVKDGVKRLYEGSKYMEDGKERTLKL